MNIKQQIKEKELELFKLKEQLNSSDPTERIKTFEDACEDQGIDPKDPKFQYMEGEDVDNSGPAFERLKIIRNSLLRNVKLVWGPNTPYKYFPSFYPDKPQGSGFSASGFPVWSAPYVTVSSRLAVNSSALAIYFGSQFESDWYNYIVEHKIIEE